MFVTNCISTTKIQKISEITNFFRHYFLSRTEVVLMPFLVKSRIPAYWVLYLLFCTILTPLIGYPLYRICILKR